MLQTIQERSIWKNIGRTGKRGTDGGELERNGSYDEWK